MVHFIYPVFISLLIAHAAESSVVSAECVPSDLEKKRNDSIKVFEDCFRELRDRQISHDFPMGTLVDDLTEEAQEYCRHVTDIKDCYTKIDEAAGPCLDLMINEKHILFFYKNVKKMLDFRCLNDGKQFADFIAVGGYRCFNRNQKNVYECVKTFLSKNQNQFNCDKMSTLNACITESMDLCEQIDYVIASIKYVYDCDPK